MTFLRRLFGTARSPEAPAEPRVLLGGDAPLDVVGESFHQDGLRAIVGPTHERVRMRIEAVLIPETNNPYDRNAVAVWIEGRQVGHLGREDAQAIRPGLLALQREHEASIALAGVIVGGGVGRPSYGVFLDYDPAAFGLPTTEDLLEVRRQPSGEIRTGFHNAIAQDAENNAFDLSWEDRMPEDRLQAITYIRRTLTTESEPLSRHFLFAMLAARLYQAREQFGSALSEFDEVCRLHDAEMDAIRPALIATFGGVPLLEVYKQSAIRHQKVHDWSAATWWARRGVEVYGADALNAEFTADLAERIEKCQAKLAEPAPRLVRLSQPAREHDPVYEVLVCRTCGRSFDRMRTRGRKPTECPNCRGIG